MIMIRNMKGNYSEWVSSAVRARALAVKRQQPASLATSSSSSLLRKHSPIHDHHHRHHHHLSPLTSSSSSSAAPSIQKQQQQQPRNPFLQQVQQQNFQMSSLVVAELEDEEWQTDDDDDDDHHHRHRRHNKDAQASSSSSSSSSSPAAPLEKHCETCTCDAASDIDHSRHHHQQQRQQEEQQQEPQLIEVHPCGAPIIENNTEDALLPPLPEPKFTYKRRVLPGTLVALDSIPGSRRLVETLTLHTAASYLPLTSHFINQSDPAYCGISTLLVVMNALSIDPMVRWRGGWRYYGHEDVLLHRCCFSSARIQRHGLAVHELAQLARCHGAHVVMKRPIPIATSAFDGDTSALTAESATTKDKNEQEDDEEEYFTLDDFRNDLISVLTTTTTTTTTTTNNDDDTTTPNISNSTMLVVSFSRAALSQTGDGHYSPVAAYHAATDSVLILDVARFKYPPYWVAVADLYRAMQPRDVVTKKSRAWFLITASAASSSSLSYSNKPATADDHGDDNAHQRQRRPRPVYDYVISNNGTNNTITKRTTYNTDPEGTIPAHLIPAVSGTSSSSPPPPTTTSCPFQAVKVEYCPAARGRSQESNAT